MKTIVSKIKDKLDYIRQAPCRRGEHPWEYYSAMRVLTEAGKHYLAYSVGHRSCPRCKRNEWHPFDKWEENRK